MEQSAPWGIWTAWGTVCYRGQDMTPRQTRFVAAYAACGQARQAAIEAGYSPASAKQQGYLLMRMSAVRSAIDAAQQRTLARLALTGDAVIQRLWDIAQDATNLNAAERACEALGRHLGVLRDEPLMVIRDITDQPLSEEEWIAEFGAGDKKVIQ